MIPELSKEDLDTCRRVAELLKYPVSTEANNQASTSGGDHATTTTGENRSTTAHDTTNGPNHTERGQLLAQLLALGAVGEVAPFPWRGESSVDWRTKTNDMVKLLEAQLMIKTILSSSAAHLGVEPGRRQAIYKGAILRRQESLTTLHAVLSWTDFQTLRLETIRFHDSEALDNWQRQIR